MLSRSLNLVNALHSQARIESARRAAAAESLRLERERQAREDLEASLRRLAAEEQSNGACHGTLV